MLKERNFISIFSREAAVKRVKRAEMRMKWRMNCK